ncbi:hypothetical protein F5Y14DRAFT_413477 [Nemania sp. NC0429]|nr:hypothetical protein F5Y14DRAFT_413477 [Nemania sp. NC0429]
MNSNHTMNNVYCNLGHEGSEMAESPIIPPSLTRNFPHSQSPPAAAGPREPELDRWKSRVPKTGNSPLVPKPLFSSAKCVVGVELTAATHELLASPSSASPPSPAAPKATVPTPITPSPSLLPVLNSTNGTVAGAVSITSSTTYQASNPVHEQGTTGSDTAAAARPRPVSSCYSQNTLTTVTATVASSPQTPIPPDWSPSLGAGLLLGVDGLRAAETQMEANAYAEIYTPAHMERVTEEHRPAPGHIPVQIQVPRLRSPSLPPRSRRRTAPNPVNNTVSVSSQGRSREGYSSWSTGPSSEQTTTHYPEMSTVSSAGIREESSWQLQKPNAVHDTPRRHEVSRSRVSDVSTPEPHSSYPYPYSHHVANKVSISSTLRSTPSRSEQHRGHSPLPPPEVASSRTSVAGSHTPIYGRGEQRSGWWSDDDDDDGGGGGRGGRRRRDTLRGAAMEIKEKLTAEGSRARKIKIIVAASVLGILIIVGVAVGVVLGVRRRS